MLKDNYSNSFTLFFDNRYLMLNVCKSNTSITLLVFGSLVVRNYKKNITFKNSFCVKYNIFNQSNFTCQF